MPTYYLDFSCVGFIEIDKKGRKMKTLTYFQVTANNSISLAQFDYAVKFEEEYREAIASGGLGVSYESKVTILNWILLYIMSSKAVSMF